MENKILTILLNHRGVENAITSKIISQMLGISEDDTHSASRKLIWEIAEENGLPLISCRKGYFIAQTDEEMNAFNANYEKRINAMRKTQQRANESYMKWKKLM